MFQPVARTWHGLTPEETAAFLQTNVDAGLSALEAAERLQNIGPNVIAPARGKGAVIRFLEQFKQSLVLILIVAGAVTAALGEWVDAGVIFGVVIINAIVGFLQEAKALQAIEALSKVMTTESMVVRDGVRSILRAEQLIPGDLVVLQSGDRVPADLRLTYSRDLQIDESALTGESLPVEKQTAPLEQDALLANRSNMAYASTLCTRGQGAGLVVDTGDATEVGKISHLIAEARVLETPLTRKISQLSRVLLYVIIALAVIAAVVGILRGEKIADMLVASVALAVGAIPEGLPAAVTIVLSIGVSRMARRRAIIRRLPAVETLGSTTVICSDKTGTLTENQMTVQKVVAAGRVYAVSGIGYAPEGSILEEGDGAAGGQEGAISGVTVSVTAGGSRHTPLLEVLKAGTLCNDSSLYLDEGRWQARGDPTEAALIVSAAKAGFHRDELERVSVRQDTLPFESEYQYMATLYATADESRVIYVKGATERLLQRSSTMMTAEGVSVPIEPAAIEAEAQRMASTGLRVLGFASKTVPASMTEMTHEDVESGLTFLGLQGMIDPPRQEAITAIEACHGAGVQVKMITGDHALTAAAIAGRLGLGPLGCAPEPFPRVLTGGDLQAVAEGDLPQVAEDTFVFARVTPEQKLRLVEALQNRGHVVAMTGDGVNDGPALRQADIGVAMGITGTEVAKEAADMVLTDDNFASIEAAVEEGRGVFDNLTKFITWTLPTNLAEGLVILVAILGGLLLPILPVQILWINMMTGIILGTSLAFEAKERGIMSRAPRPARSPIIDRVLVGRIILVGAMLVAGSFLLFAHAQNIGHSVAEARTVASNVIVFGELAFLFNCRSLTLPSWRVSVQKNWALVGGALLMACMQMLYTYVPALNHLFGTAALGISSWGWIVGLAIGVHVVVEIEKWIRRRRADRIAAASAC